MVVFSVVTFNIIINQCRSVWFAIIVATIVTLVSLLVFFRSVLIEQLRKTDIIRKVVLVLLIAVGSSFIATHLVKIDSESENHVLNTTETRSGSADNPLLKRYLKDNGRFEIWENTISIIREKPLTGIGVGNYKIVYPKYSTGNFRFNPYGKPHNDYLWIFAETGIFGLSCYLLIFVFILLMILKLLKTRRDTEKKIVALLMLFGITGYLVIAFFSNPRSELSHQILLIVILAIVISDYYSEKRLKREPGMRVNVLIFIAILIVSGLSIVVGGVRVYSTINMNIASEALKSRDYKRSIKYIDRATTLFSRISPSGDPIVLFRTRANFGNRNYLTTIKDCKRAIEINPFCINAYYFLGKSNFKLNYNLKAIDNYSEALKLGQAENNKVKIHFDRGISYSMGKRYSEAIDDFTRVINLSPEHNWAYIKRGLVYIKTGNTISACNDFNAAYNIEPEIAERYINRYCR